MGVKEGLKIDLEELKLKENIDIIDILEEEIINTRENLISEIRPSLIKLDPSFEEDPNPIYKQKLEAKSILSKGKTKGRILYEDLTSRSIGAAFSEEHLRKVNDTTIGFCGVGASNQSGIMMWARLGLGHFILADYDKMESSNASRQLFCYSSTLGRKKVDVVKNFIKEINDEAVVEVYDIKVDKNNVESIFDGVEYIHDGIDNVEGRITVNEYARENNIPWLNSAACGNEGRYILFMPDDPSYEKVCGRSLPKLKRGVNPLVPILLANYKINDTVKLITGKGKTIRYPKFLSINMERMNPVAIRDLQNIPIYKI